MLKIFSNFRSLEDPLYDRFKARCVDKPITLFYDYIPQSIEDLQHNPYNFLLLHVSCLLCFVLLNVQLSELLQFSTLFDI